MPYTEAQWADQMLSLRVLEDGPCFSRSPSEGPQGSTRSPSLVSALTATQEVCVPHAVSCGLG